MEKTVRYVDEDTLEIKHTIIVKKENIKDVKTELDKNNITELTKLIEESLEKVGCNAEEFGEAFDKYKKAEDEFMKIYAPFKDKLIKLHEEYPDLVKTLIIGDARMTYVSPSVRDTIDTKRLKEEEPEIAKLYTKTSDVKASVRLGVDR